MSLTASDLFMAEEYDPAAGWEECEDHLGRTHERPRGMMPTPPGDATVIDAESFPRNHLIHADPYAPNLLRVRPLR